MSDKWVLDTYAVLALLGGEPGSDFVVDLLRQAHGGEIDLLMNWVNVGEVAYIVERRYGKAQLYKTLATLEATALRIVLVGQELALSAAEIKATHTVSYADAFAAALARQTGSTLVTGDPEFKLFEDVIPIHWLPQRE